jgi:hypothetical protein
MKNSFQDGITEKFEMKMEDYGVLVEEFKMKNLKKTTKEIIDYLNDIRCTVTPGLALRRYLCHKFGRKTDTGYKFTLSEDRVVSVGDYTDDSYDIQKDELGEYTKIFTYYNAKYNRLEDGYILSNINEAEARRLLKVTTSFSRQKMFEISFALHMDSDDMFKFLTDYLAEPTYNYRDPKEIIAYYCHTHDEVNNYIDYLRIVKEYENRSESIVDKGSAINNYTEFARFWTQNNIETEEDLYAFLLNNRANFNGYSQTAYNEFMALYNKVKEIINFSNNDQLAKTMLYIPRATVKKFKKDGSYEPVNDFVSITNTESARKPQTTLLPKNITENLPLRGRLDDLVSRKKPVERKDLVLFKFYLFYLEMKGLEESTENFKFTSKHSNMFINECNNMLVRCGMSRLYPANRFDNLILLSLYADNPYEFFDIIIENSFIYEADYVEVGQRGRKKKKTEDDSYAE